jgi:hypothetical protein
MAAREIFEKYKLNFFVFLLLVQKDNKSGVVQKTLHDLSFLPSSVELPPLGLCTLAILAFLQPFLTSELLTPFIFVLFCSTKAPCSALNNLLSSYISPSQ